MKLDKIIFPFLFKFCYDLSTPWGLICYGNTKTELKVRPCPLFELDDRV